jgi:5-hydroxyisourate hydrolase
MSAITTHVLDTALGRPAAGVPVRLERADGHEQPDPHNAWGAEEAALVAGALGEGTTDADGRVRELGPERITAGRYRLVFDTASYFQRTGQRGFFPEVVLTFHVEDPAQHYHVPLLLSPFAYSTYRGS